MIKLERLTKSFDGRTTAVDRVDLHVHRGELFVLVGASGCGKTTTLKMINRLIEPTAGTIRIDEDDVSGANPVELRRSIGYVFQGIGLFPHMTVAENIGIVPGLLAWPRDVTVARVDELMELVGLPPREYGGRFPSQLSGGQRQRIGLARALAARPRIMLMDEPFGALDPVTRDALQEEYARIHTSLGLTTVMVTHDMAEALLLASRIAVMEAGRVVRIGTPRELLSTDDGSPVARLMETPLRHARRLEQLVVPVSGEVAASATMHTPAPQSASPPPSPQP